MIASTHLFRFRSYRDAGRNLYCDRRRLDATPGLRFWSLPFTGSTAHEGMQPGIVEPRRHMAWCLWDDEAALERFRSESRIGRAWLQTTDEYCEIRSRPYRAYGSFRGAEPLAGLERGRPGDAPVLIWTFANIPARNLRRFYDGIVRSTKVLLESPGLIAATAGPQHWFTGATTLTIWESEARATRFAYREEPHREIVRDVRAEQMLTDSMFIRMTPYRVLGEWTPGSRFTSRVTQLAQQLEAVPAEAHA